MATQIRPNLDCSQAEWQARQELAASYRIFDMLGWSESVYNHISLRVPEEEGAFLINPYGLHYSEVCASNLVKIDIDGNKLAESAYGVNLAGFTQHAYFHRHLPRAHAICHVHTTETMAVCSLEEGLMPLNFYACNLMGKLAYHDFEGVTVRAEEGERLLANLGDKNILMLRNHGPVVMAHSLPFMLLQQWLVQRACEIQIATLSMGQPAIRVADDVIAVHQRDIGKASPPGGPGVGEFQAWMRRIDKIDRSWRD